MSVKRATSKKSITSAAAGKADSVKAQDVLWKLLDGSDSHLITLENRLTVLRELYAARLAGDADDCDFALLAHVKDILESFGHARQQINVAYRCLTGEANIEGGAR